MGNLSILVVDDDEDVRTMLCVLLSAEGYAVAGAVDGVDALRRMHAAPPALALVDLMMPRMNGEDLIGAMASDETLAGIPVAILSGQRPAGRAASHSFVIAHLTKPVELEELLAVVHRCVGGAPMDATEAPAG